MRLHALTLRAFGSFGGDETIDFDRLADGGLFLLHGPTGAGKTTVLDAVSFALFGTVPGVRPTGLGLRSHHAPATTSTEVRLEVTIDGRRFRIVRRPRQLRPKRRGEGTVEDAPTATVEELVAGGWVVRAARPAEADPYLQDLLHMGVTQFHQIVMLPQGDFARFLRASADERRVVLEELFATHRFTEVERWLRARADHDQAAVSEADTAIRDLLVAAAEVADVEPFPRDRPVAEGSAWLVEGHEAVTERRQRTLADEQRARARHAVANQELSEAATRAERQQRHAAAVRARAQLDERADQHLADRHRRDEAQRAEAVRPLLAQLTEAGARCQELAAAVAAARAGLISVGSELAEADGAGLAAHAEAILTELGQIADLVVDEQQLAGRETEVAGLAAQLDELAADRRSLVDQRAALPHRRAAQATQLDEARRRAVRVDDLRAQLDILAERHAAAVALEQRRREVDDLRTRHQETAARALTTRRTWLERYETQLANRAAVLAASLAEGQPCPVCGSPEHPAPAAGDAAPVTDDEVAAARAEAEAAAEVEAELGRALASAEAELAALAATAGEHSPAQLAEAVAIQREEHRLAATAGQRIEALELALADADARAAELDAELEALSSRRVALEAHRAELDGALGADRERVIRARGSFPTLAARAADLQARRNLIVALVDALDEQVRADADVLAALTRAEEEATRGGFATLADAAGAVVSPDELDELTATIEAHQRALAETDGDLHHPDLLAAAACEPVDLEAAQRGAAEADRLLELASLAADRAKRADERLAQHRLDIDARLVELAPRLDAADCSRRLADLASGDDRQVEHRMRLSTYVLAARLEQVAAAASERLARMSGGRYTIVHTDEVTDGRRKGGLGLRVIDAWTSTERETASLSGGESFFTSLALALGVADVVSAEVGGRTMETMFIDEGFGSLDDDTLQDVLDVLDDLRAGGRAIGIVSHVGDLRTRIPHQLEVVKTATGSRLRTRGLPGRSEGPAGETGTAETSETSAA